MTSDKHGLSFGIERIKNELMLTFKISGKLTHEDYEVFVPMIDAAAAEVKEPKIKAFVDLTEFDGWELRAAWDDFKLGLKHGSEFTKMAIVGNKSWEKWATKVGSWFIAGETEYFEDEEKAREWLCS